MTQALSLISFSSQVRVRRKKQSLKPEICFLTTFKDSSLRYRYVLNDKNVSSSLSRTRELLDTLHCIGLFEVTSCLYIIFFLFLPTRNLWEIRILILQEGSFSFHK